MRIASVEGEVVLEAERRDPHVIHGDWCPLTAELVEDGGVVDCGLQVGAEDRDAGSDEKLHEDLFVFRTAGAACEADAQFADDRERQEDFICLFEDVCNGRIAAVEVAVTIRIEREPQLGHEVLAALISRARGRSDPVRA